MAYITLQLFIGICFLMLFGHFYVRIKETFLLISFAICGIILLSYHIGNFIMRLF